MNIRNNVNSRSFDGRTQNHYPNRHYNRYNHTNHTGNIRSPHKSYQRYHGYNSGRNIRYHNNHTHYGPRNGNMPISRDARLNSQNESSGGQRERDGRNNSSRKSREDYRPHPDGYESFPNSSRSGSTLTGKRSYDESTLGDKEEGKVGSIKTAECTPSVQSTLNDLTLVGLGGNKEICNEISLKLIDLVGKITKANGNRQVVKQKFSNNIPRKEKKKTGMDRVQRDTPFYDNEPIFMLEEECDEYRIATNGQRFKIKMITVGDRNLPVPIWENDKRKMSKLKIQASNNARSRNLVNVVAARKARTIIKSKSPTIVERDDANAKGNRTIATDVTFNDSSNINSNKSSDYYSTLDCRVSNILLIGLSYSSIIRDQYLGDCNIDSITQCKDYNGRVIDQCVARDTFRCYALEELYPNVKVFTVNKCQDTLRTCDNNSDPYNINCDVCTNQFIKLLKLKN